MRTILLAALAVVATLGEAQAQYPAKPVSLVVAWPAGGPTDTIARRAGSAAGPEDFGAFMRSEMAKWGKLIRERQIRTD